MRHPSASRTARLLTALDEAAAALLHPVSNAIVRAPRLAVRSEGRRRARLAAFYQDVLSFVPAECAGSRRELEQEIAKLGV